MQDFSTVRSHKSITIKLRERSEAFTTSVSVSLEFVREKNMPGRCGSPPCFVYTIIAYVLIMPYVDKHSVKVLICLQRRSLYDLHHWFSCLLAAFVVSDIFNWIHSLRGHRPEIGRSGKAKRNIKLVTDSKWMRFLARLCRSHQSSRREEVVRLGKVERCACKRFVVNAKETGKRTI